MSGTGAPTRTLAELVRERTFHQADQIVLAVDDGATLTLGAWLERSSHVAAVLQERGIAAGDPVVLVVDDEDWIGYAVGNLAIHLAGGTAVGLTMRLGGQAVAARTGECQAHAVLLAGRAGLPDVGVPVWPVRDLEQTPSSVGLSAGPAAGEDPGAMAEIVYTSGTTGPAKRVAVSHASLTFGRDGRGELFGGIASILCAIPSGTNAGHSALMVALTTGSRVNVLREITADTMAAAIEREGIEHAILPPGTAADLVASGAHQRYDLSSLRALMFGSSAVPDRVISALSEAIPQARIMIGYGSTEAAPAFTRRALPAWEEHGDASRYRRIGLQSLGWPGGGTEVAVTGAGGRHLPPGEIGEICLRAEAAPRRYYLGDDPRTAGVFSEDGWVRMGDLGLVSGDGELLFVDRIPDSIVTRGHQVSSAMVENALLWHPSVRSAAVFAVPDPGLGQVAVAAVESAPGASPAELAEFLAAELESADRPAAVLVVPALPRGITGKVLKSRLRELHRQGLPRLAPLPAQRQPAR